MKNLFITLCCFFGIKAASAQEIIRLDIDSASFVKRLVIPNLKNLQKLVNAPQKDFVATMVSLGYKLSKLDDHEFYAAADANGDALFGVMKSADQTSVSVMFFQKTDYPKQMMERFVSQYGQTQHEKVKGADGYYFKIDDGNGGTKDFCIIFDNRKKTCAVSIVTGN
ncbi:MAG TPA: hypothetical protein VFE53_11415 [Mucilaginibacter sp.]|nr:hypothetical protein [Mucilaginibacter sp.]